MSELGTMAPKIHIKDLQLLGTLDQIQKTFHVICHCPFIAKVHITIPKFTQIIFVLLFEECLPTFNSGISEQSLLLAFQKFN